MPNTENERHAGPDRSARYVRLTQAIDRALRLKRELHLAYQELDSLQRLVATRSPAETHAEKETNLDAVAVMAASGLK